MRRIAATEFSVTLAHKRQYAARPLKRQRARPGNAHRDRPITRGQGVDRRRGQASGGDSPARRRRWLWKTLAVLGVPLLLLVLVEGGLRFAGVGHPTAFFLPGHVQDHAVWLNNPRYGWRFCPPSLARDTWPVAFPVEKQSGVKRIFLLGESAAMGDPDPRFGLLRMLEALLKQRFPEQGFELVNVAFTAINSHVILPIARECARRDGDVWIIYMGNNEVVGPFGSGTVFGRRVPPMVLARASVALKTLRIGQGLEAAADRLRSRNRPPDEWGGMGMFLNHQVPQRDRRMKKVYTHFERNLQDILKAGRRAGVGIVLSTVGTNLRDSAPFASLHRADLMPERLAEWEAMFQSGIDRQAAGDHAGALAAYQQALALDDQYAELHFRVATCLQSLGRIGPAADHYRRARDADTLRFRADTSLNDIIRGCAKGYQGAALRFFDGEQVLAQHSPDHLTGRECFYEHVHLTPHGNYLLARGMAEQVADLLNLENTSAQRAPEWASEEECRRWLGLTDRGLHNMLSLMLRRMSDSPFTLQLDHTKDLKRLEDARLQHRNSTRPTQIKRMAKSVESVAATRPTDGELRSVLAELLDVAGDEQGARREWHAALARLPNAPNFWYRFADFLDSRGRRDEALDAYRRCLDLFPWHSEARAHLRALSD